MNKEDIKMFIMIVSYGLLSLFLGYTLSNGLPNITSKIPFKQQEFKSYEYQYCGKYNNTLEVSNCLNEYIIRIHNFTERDERFYRGNDGSLEDVLKNGGDCYDYTQIYIKMANDLNFQAKEINIYAKDKLSPGHSFVVIYDNNLSQYCLLDQKVMHGCTSLK